MDALTIKRTPASLCCLCEHNPAIKTKSHIFSKFISTNFLGAKGTPKRGFEIDSSKIMSFKPKPIQDSPKEDYILCEECEAYFSVIEGLVANTFKEWEAKSKSGEFPTNDIIPSNMSIVSCTTANSSIIALFVYSLFWRASISQHPLFDYFRLPDDFEKNIQDVLFKYRSITQSAFTELLNNNPNFNFYPHSIITANSFLDETANLIFAQPAAKNPFALIVDRFSFLLFEDVKFIDNFLSKNFTNTSPGTCKILVLSQKNWQQLIVENTFKLMAESTVASK